MTILFKNATGNGISPEIHTSTGGQHVVTISGVFDGASVDFQVKSPNDTTWVSNKVYPVAENDPVTFLPKGYQVRGVISSAGALTDIFMEIGT